MRRCPSFPRRLCELISTTREESRIYWMESVRLACFRDPQDCGATENYVELKRPDGGYTVLRISWRMLPRNGGRVLLLLCPYCNTAPPFRLRLGMGQFFGMVKQSQANCLAMPFMRYATVLFRRRLPAPGLRPAWTARRHASRLLGKSTTAGVLASLCVYVHR